jgi:hypothetical protein
LTTVESQPLGYPTTAKRVSTTHSVSIVGLFPPQQSVVSPSYSASNTPKARFSVRSEAPFLRPGLHLAKALARSICQHGPKVPAEGCSMLMDASTARTFYWPGRFFPTSAKTDQQPNAKRPWKR